MAEVPINERTPVSHDNRPRKLSFVAVSEVRPLRRLKRPKPEIVEPVDEGP